MKKHVTIVLLSLMFPSLYSQPFDEYKESYVVGDKVNVRDSSSVKSKVIFQVNWGDEVHIKKLNKDWYELMSYDEASVFFIHSDYVKNKDDFIKKALKREIRNSKTDLILIQYFLDKQDYDRAVRLAVKLINTLPEETILTGFERCELVSYSAFSIMTNPKLDIEIRRFIRERLKSKTKNLTILNLLELDEIEDLIRNKEYELSNEKLNKILVKSNDNLFLNIACDYDHERKVYPQIWFKNLYFINYHLISAAKKNEIIRYLKKIRDDKSMSERTKNMAVDIYGKLSTLWEVN